MSPPVIYERKDRDWRTDEEYVMERYYMVEMWNDVFIATSVSELCSIPAAFKLCLGLWWAIIPIHLARFVLLGAIKGILWLENCYIPKKFVLKDGEKGEGVRSTPWDR
jgi:hypothetical protein